MIKLLFTIILFTFFSNNVYSERLLISPNKFNMSSLTINDYDNGYKEYINAQTLSIKNAKYNWKVLIKTNNNNMGTVGSYSKSINDFEWKAAGTYATQITYTSITNFDIEAGRGSDKNASFDADYKIILAWDKDVPGEYEINLLYTLTTQ